MRLMRKFSDYLKEESRDREFSKAFNDEKVYADLAIQIARLRQDLGYTQKDIAKLLRTTQQTVSRLENPHNGSMSVSTLIRLARIYHKNLMIRFV